MTSSCVTITSGEPNGHYDENHWADVNKTSFYQKSKLLAEKALWEIHKSQAEDHHTEMVVVMPSLLFGPTIVDNLGPLSYS